MQVSMLRASTDAAGPPAPVRQRRCVVQRRRSLRATCLHKALDRKVRALEKPEDVTFECLTLLRRPDVAQLTPYLPLSFDPSVQSAHVRVGCEVVEEAGPLACCAPFMDTAARRVLPGHLLRRCRVLSSMHIGDTCQQRVALTACTGEEAVFLWRMRRTQPADGAASGPSTSDEPAGAGIAARPQLQTAAEAERVASHYSAGVSTSSRAAQKSGVGPVGTAGHGFNGSSPAGAPPPPPEQQEGGGSSSMWLVESIARDDSQDDELIPAQPHPRCSPEILVKGQLAALRLGDLVGASAFNLWSRSTSGGWDVHLRAFKELLQRPNYAPLLQHATTAELGGAALVSQRKLLQAVVLTPHRGGAAEQVSFVFQLGMQANGCWMVEAVRACGRG